MKYTGWYIFEFKLFIRYDNKILINDHNAKCVDSKGVNTIINLYDFITQ